MGTKKVLLVVVVVVLVVTAVQSSIGDQTVAPLENRCWVFIQCIFFSRQCNAIYELKQMIYIREAIMYGTEEIKS
jgi:hypothetical protein